VALKAREALALVAIGINLVLLELQTKVMPVALEAGEAMMALLVEVAVLVQ
jgi:hypothetical protein